MYFEQVKVIFEAAFKSLFFWAFSQGSVCWKLQLFQERKGFSLLKQLFLFWREKKEKKRHRFFELWRELNWLWRDLHLLGQRWWSQPSSNFFFGHNFIVGLWINSFIHPAILSAIYLFIAIVVFSGGCSKTSIIVFFSLFQFRKKRQTHENCSSSYYLVFLRCN